jgi:glycosyltransferase involved in cell wall biosynthesis
MDTRMRGKGGIGTYITQISERFNLESLHFRAPLYSLWEQLGYPFQIPCCDIFFSPHISVPLLPVRAKKRITTVHDVYHLDYGHSYPLRKRLAMKQLYKQALLGSDLVITVSAFSKGRILHHFPQARVEVIHLGADHLLEVEPKEVHGIPEHYYLFVGTHKSHKNRGLLEELPIVDVMGQYKEGELVWLYKNAKALIFPSLYEGFGLPPLEAMSLGCPVVASDAASIPEVCGDAALYFDPHKRRDLERALEMLDGKGSYLVEQGLRRASAFVWEECVQRHHALFALFGDQNDFLFVP